MRLLFMLTFVYSITIYGQQQVGNITMLDGSIVPMYDGSNSSEKKTIYGLTAGRFGPVAFHEDDFFYFDESGSIQSVEHISFSSVDFIDDRISFVPNPHYKNKAVRIHRVIAKNDAYILGYYTSGNGDYLYIHTLEGEMVERRIGFWGKRQRKKMNEIISEYFPNCSELQEQLLANREILKNDEDDIYSGNSFLVREKAENIRHYYNSPIFRIIGNIDCSN